jgi:hypothetical protein
MALEIRKRCREVAELPRIPLVTPNDVDLRQDEAFNARLAKKIFQCID